MAKHPNYEIFEEIGRSENSVVFRAWDLLLKRDVAIKELVSDPGSDGGRSDEQRISQFLQEASFLAQFEHENVLRIHTVAKEHGWIVMELMKGSLQNQITSGPMQGDVVRSVIRQVLNALDFLHSKDKVHGSVRPSNILINQQGTVKLSDFEASSRGGELRAPKGSKKYLAPELIRSEFGSFGPTVDLYCLGFAALELLTGNKFDSLFPGTGKGAIDADVAWMRWHSSDEPMPPIKTIAPNVPDDLALVIDHLLEKPVDRRPQNAAAVLKLLDDAPLLPVEVITTSVKSIKQQDLAAILPSKAVKLREPARKKTPNESTKRTVESPSGKEKLNQILGKPFILWPICVAILASAVLLGLHLRGEKNPPGNPIADKDKPGLVAPEPEPLSISLNVFPNPDEASLLIEGNAHEFENLKLHPGSYEIAIQKEGYEPLISLLDVNKDSTNFDISLKKITKGELVKAEKDPGTPTAEKPEFIEVRITLAPENADLFLAGERVELSDGILRLDTESFSFWSCLQRQMDINQKMQVGHWQILRP